MDPQNTLKPNKGSICVSILKPIYVEPSGNHTATVIFLHGSGGAGPEKKEGVDAYLGRPFTFEHVRVIYPTAPPRPYSLAGGALTTVWFDRLSLSMVAQEQLDGIDESVAAIQQLVDAEVQKGIPLHRIIVGGHSMGGAMALYYGYKHNTNLGGVFALASFLAKGSSVYKNLESHQDRLPPLLQCHGTDDRLVNFAWGQATAEHLQKLGVKVTFLPYPGIDHDLGPDIIEKVYQWISDIVPEAADSKSSL